MKNQSKHSIKKKNWRGWLIVGTSVVLSAPLFTACAKDSIPASNEATLATNNPTPQNSNEALTKNVVLNVSGMT